MAYADVDAEVNHCADCGAIIEWRRVGWAQRTGPREWRYVCRTMWDGYMLMSADYHYVEGEEQRRFVAPRFEWAAT